MKRKPRIILWYGRWQVVHSLFAFRHDLKRTTQAQEYCDARNRKEER